MNKDIKMFVERCKICAEGAPERQNTKKKNKYLRNNEIWLCDLVGRIQIDKNSNIFIFVAIDHYTKCLEAMIIENKISDSVIKPINEFIIKKHGFNFSLFTDQGFNL